MNPPRLELTSPTWTSSEDGATHLWSPLGARGPLPPEVFTVAPSRRTGQWALVETDGGAVRLVTDRIRSHHLLFARHDGTWLVSDDPSRMRGLLPRWRRDEPACDVFLHTGFTVGTRTLVEGVCATPAASIVELHEDGTWEHRLWEDYRFDADPVTDPDVFGERFAMAMDTAVARVLEAAGGRQLVLPLSGGLDSRLLAAWLRRLGADNVTSFTYGVPGSRETGVSRDVASGLGLPWFAVEIDPGEMAGAWFGEEGARFQAATWGLTSLPHVQDWYALREIRHRGLVDDDAVFLPGHTIVGNTHDEAVLDEAPTVSEILTLVARHHAVLQGRPDAYRRLPLLRRELVEAAAELGCGAGFPPTGRWAQELIEWFNLRERQAKYINNSMKGYEAFGYGWALPMLDTEVWRTWLTGSQDLTATRRWYADFTLGHVARITGQAPALYAPTRTSVPPMPRRVLLGILRATGGDRVLSRCRSVRTQMRHPMGFEAFAATMPRAEQLGRFIAGASSLGLWTRLFLDGSWGSSPMPGPSAALQQEH